MKTIQINLTDSEIRSLRADRGMCADLINAGRCCEVLDLGLSVIDIHNILIKIENALDKVQDERRKSFYAP